MAIETTSHTEQITYTDEEARQRFEEIVQKELGISTEEFLRRLDAGFYVDGPEDRAAVRVSMFLHLVR
ncbi:MAG: hypothetical protein WEB00_02315 [Dehalococcoidia bacterium]